MSISPMRKKPDLIFFVNEPEPIFESFTETSPVEVITVFSILCFYFPFKKDVILYFLISMISLFCYFLLCKERRPSFEQTTITLYPGMLCAMCGWNWPGGSGEHEDMETWRGLLQQWRHILDKVDKKSFRPRLMKTF